MRRHEISLHLFTDRPARVAFTDADGRRCMQVRDPAKLADEVRAVLARYTLEPTQRPPSGSAPPE